ncbi:MAG: ArsC/Spx/MgsR family protein [Pseudomonadota bacterium]
MIEVYGMASCTTVRNGVQWLEAEGYTFSYSHFGKVKDLAGHLRRWISATELTAVLNTRAANFRKLPEVEQAHLVGDTEAAVAAMVDNPRLIKRPLVAQGDVVIPGFDAERWTAELTR